MGQSGITKQEKDRSVILNNTMQLYAGLYDNTLTAQELAIYLEHIRAAHPKEAQLLALICDTDVNNLTYAAVQAIPLMKTCIIMNSKIARRTLLNKGELLEIFMMIIALNPDDLVKPFNEYLLAIIGPGIYTQWLIANHLEDTPPNDKKTIAKWSQWRSDVDLNPTVGDVASILISLMNDIIIKYTLKESNHE